ncbi:hypothetical protein ANO14919_088780 [Xylariales sp. No.14919]|nr:hypothetical protein ANO14919_088780 [Xylariales sp. No.14919]
MGVGPDVVTYTSDYFDHLYETCLTLIKGGHAYADNTDAETTRDERGRGVESKRRNRTVEENANVFEQMKSGTEEGLKNCIRAKINVDNPNKARRDLSSIDATLTIPTTVPIRSGRRTRPTAWLAPSSTASRAWPMPAGRPSIQIAISSSNGS